MTKRDWTPRDARAQSRLLPPQRDPSSSGPGSSGGITIPAEGIREVLLKQCESNTKVEKQ